jgi:ATP-dependent helicase/nuclease subunit A
MAPRRRRPLWHVSREDGAWALAIEGLAWEEPEGRELAAQEGAWLAAERRRLVYVAGTRARDLLVLPVATGGKGGSGDRVTNALAGEASPALEVLPEWTGDRAPAWARGVAPPAPRKPTEAAALAASVEAAWRAASAESGRARLEPRAVSARAHARVEAEGEGEAGGRGKERESRHGRTFGDTVHLAVGAALREPGLPPAGAVARAARATGLGEHLDEAADDVGRALAALEREGLRRRPGPDLRLEYPVAAEEDGALLQGYVDLLAAEGAGLAVVDFKTDAPPRRGAEADHPAYVEQVRAYGRLLVKLGLARPGAVRCGLLYTADGGIRWV